MRIAVVGAGISGLSAARSLAAVHDVTVFEADARAGGHAWTVPLDTDEGPLGLDVGFMVFNERSYPLFSAMLRELGVSSQPTDMTLSVRDESSGLEYKGSTLGTLFAQRRNLLRPSFHRMAFDILRFYREAREVPGASGEPTLREWLRERRYGRSFVDHHVVPLGSALWSSSAEAVLDFPVRFYVRFMERHEMLTAGERPAWLTVRGGSRRYVAAIEAELGPRLRLGSAVTSVARTADGVEVRVGKEHPQRFDRAIMACHSDQALRLLREPSADERRILGAIPYQSNEGLLHSDEGLMPRTRRAWAAWNCHVLEGSREVAVTYHLNRLQAVRTRRQYFVTLNRQRDVDPSLVHASLRWEHPLFSPAAVRAQGDRGLVSGADRIHYCGAYWGFGFHEDGVESGLLAAAEVRVAAATARTSEVARAL